MVQTGLQAGSLSALIAASASAWAAAEVPAGLPDHITSGVTPGPITVARYFSPSGGRVLPVLGEQVAEALFSVWLGASPQRSDE